ncbi:PadR family transcriptional regulator [Arenivirga flava]|uniref:PadR family transcriptional regulator n=1 Tax=Arenivirga flava TaxID=1930060 RepID=A0AA37UGM6_9MICO|nr:hypothetical protein [Arenivirga flava]GMA27716.1 hypothetical protein GCM10025874_09690 [Arenivirga flava]
MHVRNGLLAVLLLGPAYTQQLAREYARRSGAPINSGQVSGTLERLARDGMVEPAGTDGAGRRRHGLSLDGRSAVEAWAESGVDEDSGAVLPLLASVDGALAVGYASARLALLRTAVDAPTETGWPEALQRERSRALAAAEAHWLASATAELADDETRYELPLAEEPRRGRPQRSA